MNWNDLGIFTCLWETSYPVTMSMILKHVLPGFVLTGLSHPILWFISPTLTYKPAILQWNKSKRYLVHKVKAVNFWNRLSSDYFNRTPPLFARLQKYHTSALGVSDLRAQETEYPGQWSPSFVPWISRDIEAQKKFVQRGKKRRGWF